MPPRAFPKPFADVLAFPNELCAAVPIFLTGLITELFTELSTFFAELFTLSASLSTFAAVLSIAGEGSAALSILALVASACCCSFSILVSTVFILPIIALPLSPAISSSDIAAISRWSCFHFSCASSIFSVVSSRLLFRRSIGSDDISNVPTSICGASGLSEDFG